MFKHIGTIAVALCVTSSAALSQGAKLSDPQIAHIAYTAGEIDIKAAKQALDKSGSKESRSSPKAWCVTTRRSTSRPSPSSRS